MRSLPGIVCSVVAAAAAGSAGADVLWTGATSNDIFDESNWDLSNSAVTVINPNVSIDDNVFISSAAQPVEIPDLSGQIRFQIGDGYSLLVDDSTLVSNGNDGVGGAAGSLLGPTVQVLNGGSINIYFVTNDTLLDITSGCAGILRGGNLPINGSAVNLTEGATLHFTDETVQDYISEHLGKTTVDGSPAVVDGNIHVVDDGVTGCIITVLPATIGTNYCIAAPNSAGGGAVMSAGGSPYISSNNLTLRAEPMPANQMGIFFYGPAQILVPFGNGYLCAGAGGAGLFRLYPPLMADGTGLLTRPMDYTNPPRLTGQITIGSAWNFQAWYLDPSGGGSGFNLSDGLGITFTP